MHIALVTFGLSALFLIFAAWCYWEYRILSNPALLASSLLLQRRSQRNMKLLCIVCIALGVCILTSGIWLGKQTEDPIIEASTIPAIPQEAPSAGINIPPPAGIDLFEPEDEAALPSVLDNVKQKYEETFVTYFFMRRCGVASPQEYHLINSALMHELASLKAPASLQQSILNAAQGSYNELYIHSSCTDPSSGALATQYRDYIQQLLSATPDS